MKRAMIILSFTGWLFLPALQAQEEKKSVALTLHGYIKDLQALQILPAPDSLHSLNLLHNRLNLGIRFSEKFCGRLEVRNRLFWGDMLQQSPDFGKQLNQYGGLADLSKAWIDKRTLVLHTVVDRALLQFADKGWEVKVGRQRINWGISNSWNPNDIFNAYNFLDFDYEERPGNDAIRVQHSGANDRSWELAYKPARKKQEHIVGFLYKFNKKSYDIQLLGGLWQQDLVVGGGWAGQIKKAGFKGEISYFHPRKHLADTGGTVSLTLMADQTFPKDWYLSVSTLFNGDPATSSENANALTGSTLTAKNLFPNRYTFLFTAMKSFTPISTMNLSVVYSPERNALILFPAWSWNMAQNADLDLVAQSYFARGSVHYKMLGTAVFIRGKWSF